MAKKKNTFTPHLQKYLNALTGVRLQSSVVNTRMRQVETAAFKSMEKHEYKKNARTVLSTHVRLFGFCPFDEKKKSCIYEGLGFTNGQAVALIDEANRRAQARCLCTAFELTERFLKTAGGELHWQRRNEIVVRRKKQFHKAVGNKRPEERTKQYFMVYVAWLCRRNCDELLKLMCKESSEFQQRCIEHCEGNLLELWKFVTFCRHTIAHQEGMLDEKTLGNLDDFERGYVQEHLSHKSLVFGGDAILPEESWVRHALGCLADFGYILYRTGSNICGMQLDYRPRCF